LVMLLPSDNVAGDSFGMSVASSKNNILAGAPGALSDQGVAYIFQTSDRGFTWTQKQKLAPSDGAGDYEFGAFGSIFEDIAIIGAPGKTYYTGAAYIFKSPDGGSTWPTTETAVLAASTPSTGDYFGSSTDVLKNFALVGAPASSVVGSAFVFKTSDGGTSWAEQAELQAPGQSSPNDFGQAVCLFEGTTFFAAIGAPLHSSASGTVEIFQSNGDGSAWNATQTLTASDRSTSMKFGYSISISDTFMIVGSPGDSFSKGAAYVFATTNGGVAWTEKQKLTISPPTDYSFFGHSVSIEGNTAVVGKYGPTGGSGNAYIFKSVLGGSLWTQLQNFASDSNLAVGEEFGKSVSLELGISPVGAPSRDSYRGGVYIFQRLCGNGVIVGSEGCDDGNVIDGDGCSFRCILEPGWDCTGQPSVCVRFSDSSTVTASVGNIGAWCS
jgi:cysteine-rich repeat protein